MNKIKQPILIGLLYLCDGKVQSYIDDHSEEEYIEGPYNQQRLLQHQDLVECIMNLQGGRGYEPRLILRL